jgi:hypothetical protein
MEALKARLEQLGGNTPPATQIKLSVIGEFVNFGLGQDCPSVSWDKPYIAFGASYTSM